MINLYKKTAWKLCVRVRERYQQRQYSTTHEPFTFVLIFLGGRKRTQILECQPDLYFLRKQPDNAIDINKTLFGIHLKIFQMKASFQVCCHDNYNSSSLYNADVKNWTRLKCVCHRIYLDVHKLFTTIEINMRIIIFVVDLFETGCHTAMGATDSNIVWSWPTISSATFVGRWPLVHRSEH